MSLVDGLLNWTCTIMRATTVDDGQGGYTYGPAQIVSTGTPMLKTTKSESVYTPDEGRQFVQHTLGIFNWMTEAGLKENDILTNLVDQNGTLETWYLDGKQLPSYYRVKGLIDPNGEHDHLECDLEAMRGRQYPGGIG